MENQYPEHEKLSAIRDKTQICGEFLEWLREEKEARLCVVNEYDEYIPLYTRVEDLLAEFFEIDLNILQKEKDKMYKELQKCNGQEKSRER